MNFSIPTHRFRRFIRGRRVARWCGWMLFLLLSATVAAQAPIAVFVEPEAPGTTVPEGHIMLRWEEDSPDAGGPTEFQLEQVLNTAASVPRIAYEGPDAGTFVSGLPPEGARFRVRARSAGESDWGPWSSELTIEVAYPPQWQVAVLTAAGAAMFIVLLGAIVAGVRRTSSTD